MRHLRLEEECILQLVVADGAVGLALVGDSNDNVLLLGCHEI